MNISTLVRYSYLNISNYIQKPRSSLNHGLYYTSDSNNYYIGKL